jgi:hypothetical protein
MLFPIFFERYETQSELDAFLTRALTDGNPWQSQPGTAATGFGSEHATRIHCDSDTESKTEAINTL